MHTTFTITQNQLRAIVAKALGCTVDQVQLSEDTAGDGFEATIVTNDPKAPGRAADMFKRWAKAPAPKPDSN